MATPRYVWQESCDGCEPTCECEFSAEELNVKLNSATPGDKETNPCYKGGEKCGQCTHTKTNEGWVLESGCDEVECNCPNSIADGAHDNLPEGGFDCTDSSYKTEEECEDAGEYWNSADRAISCSEAHKIAHGVASNCDGFCDYRWAVDHWEMDEDYCGGSDPCECPDQVDYNEEPLNLGSHGLEEFITDCPAGCIGKCYYEYSNSPAGSIGLINGGNCNPVPLGKYTCSVKDGCFKWEGGEFESYEECKEGCEWGACCHTYEQNNWLVSVCLTDNQTAGKCEGNRFPDTKYLKFHPGRSCKSRADGFDVAENPPCSDSTTFI